jgi:hypothetical protein
LNATAAAAGDGAILWPSVGEDDDDVGSVAAGGRKGSATGATGATGASAT